MTTLSRVARTLKAEGSQVVFLTGAGTSVSAGIPDFRSPGGMYDTLRPELLTASPDQRAAMDSDPTQVVSWSMFSQNQFPYLEVRRPFILGIAEKKWRPTATHFFMRLCEDKGKLKRVLTQNIDGLDYQTGISDEKIVSVHGSMGQIACEGCNASMDSSAFKSAVRTNIKDIYGVDGANANAPRVSKEILCEECGRPLVKPNTVLYGRSLPPAFFTAVEEDFPADGGMVNILFVAGTSLTVQPAASVPAHATASFRVVVDLHPVGGNMFDFGSGEEENKRDIFLQGKCDEVFVDLAAECGWLDELASFAPEMSESSKVLIGRKLEERSRGGEGHGGGGGVELNKE